MNKTFRNRMVDKGNALHKNLTAFLRQKMGSDWKYFKHGYLIMGERVISVNFDRNNYEVTCYNYKNVDGYERQLGDGFSLTPYWSQGFLVRINFAKSDEKNITLLACKKPHPWEGELTKQEMKEFEDYIDELDRELPTLQYDRERTHQAWNLRWDCKDIRRKAIYKEEMAKLPEGATMLPAVEVAVDWWIKQMTGSVFQGEIGIPGLAGAFADAMIQTEFSKYPPLENNIIKFRDVLSAKITQHLSEGEEIRLTTDYAPEGELWDAMQLAHIVGIRAPMKTSMLINIERVCVNGNDIFKCEHDVLGYLETEEPTTEAPMSLKRRNKNN